VHVRSHESYAGINGSMLGLLSVTGHNGSSFSNFNIVSFYSAKHILTHECDRQTDRLTDMLTANAELNYVVRPITNSVSYYVVMLTSHCN